MSDRSNMTRDDAEDLWLAALLPAPAYMTHGLVRERHLTPRGARIYKEIADLYDGGWDSMVPADLRLPDDVLRSIPARAARPESQTRVAEAEAVLISSWARSAYALALRQAADVAERSGPEAADAQLWEAQTRIRAESTGVEWISAAEAVKTWLRAKRARLAEIANGSPFGCTIERINEACGNWAPRRMTLVQGYTSDGKSTWMLQVLNDLALTGMSCHYISLEDPPEVFGGRLVAMHLDDADLHALAALRSQHYGEPELDVVQALIRQGLEQLPLKTVWHSGYTIDRVVAAIMDAGRCGARVIAVDYIQKLLRKGDDPNIALEIYANAMKDACSAVGAHLILVSQIARPGSHEKQRDALPPPTLFSARGSGGLENAAETVVSPFRPEKDKHLVFEPAQLLINKAKDAPTGVVHLWWDRVRALYVQEDEKNARQGKLIR